MMTAISNSPAESCTVTDFMAEGRIYTNKKDYDKIVAAKLGEYYCDFFRLSAAADKIEYIKAYIWENRAVNRTIPHEAVNRD